MTGSGDYIMCTCSAAESQDVWPFIFEQARQLAAAYAVDLMCTHRQPLPKCINTASKLSAACARVWCVVPAERAAASSSAAALRGPSAPRRRSQQLAAQQQVIRRVCVLALSPPRRLRCRCLAVQQREVEPRRRRAARDESVAVCHRRARAPVQGTGLRSIAQNQINISMLL